MKLRDLVHDSITGPNGTVDPVRLLFCIGGLNGVICPPAFQVWAMILKGADAWDVAAFCLAYGGMLGAIVTAGGIAIGNKDRNTAQAQATLSDTAIKENLNA